MSEFEQMKARVLAKMEEDIEPPPYKGQTREINGKMHKQLSPIALMKGSDVILTEGGVLFGNTTYWRPIDGPKTEGSPND